MPEIMEKIIKGLDCCLGSNDCDIEPNEDCPYKGNGGLCAMFLRSDILTLLKDQEPIKPTINEYGEAYCVCGENVGIIPSSKNLPSIRSKYCSECGRRMKWE